MAVALIVAAGSGERLGAGQPKAFVELAGRQLFLWSLIALAETQGIERIAVALPEGAAQEARQLAIPVPDPPEIVFVPGGGTRSESVRCALEAGDPGDPVLVHDAARPLLTSELARRVIAALEHTPAADAAIAAIPATDTIKRVGADGAVRETLDRSELWVVQTPQVFRRGALERALDVPAAELARATDDAWLVERAGGRVVVVQASAENLKVTGPLDLRVAESLLLARSAPGGAAGGVSGAGGPPSP